MSAQDRERLGMPGHLDDCPCMRCRDLRKAFYAALPKAIERAPLPPRDKSWEQQMSPWWSLTLLASPLYLIANAWVLLCAWEWFIMPLGVPAIELTHAGGITAIVAMLRASKVDTEPMNNAKALRGAVALVVRPLSALGALWIWHWCAT